jgi:hypothetical protein
MTKQNVKSMSKASHIPNCKVIEIGLDHFAECPQQGPQPCSHALPFGYCFLCTHPQVDEMIENTRKAERMAHMAG